MRRPDSFEKTCFWERLRAGGEGDNRGWDGWISSLTQWNWVWVDTRRWWWTGRPGMLWFMGCKELDMTEQLNWTELNLGNCLEFLLTSPSSVFRLRVTTFSVKGKIVKILSMGAIWLPLKLHNYATEVCKQQQKFQKWMGILVFQIILCTKSDEGCVWSLGWSWPISILVGSVN